MELQNSEARCHFMKRVNWGCLAGRTNITGKEGRVAYAVDLAGVNKLQQEVSSALLVNTALRQIYPEDLQLFRASNNNKSTAYYVLPWITNVDTMIWNERKAWLCPLPHRVELIFQQHKLGREQANLEYGAD
ncbi:hypothetical protein WMY93_011433 [Mugilogobius chulae]|uniref:Uncharacterized protein n=1 Tax=Mugilogobius chulae TaxID=88201 RepID=A0AAW0P256_9GOBI